MTADSLEALRTIIAEAVRRGVDEELERRGVIAGDGRPAEVVGPLERRLQPIVRDQWWGRGEKPTQQSVALEAGYQTRSGLQRAMDREDARLEHSTGMWERLTARRPNRAQPGGTRLHPRRHAATSGASTSGGRPRKHPRP